MSGLQGFMKASFENTTGLILAGGRGRRVNEQDKGLLCLQGKPMIEYQLDWFSGQVNKVLISANRNIEEYQSYGLPVIVDQNTEENFAGPLEGVFRGLQKCATSWLFVQPVDMPNMPINVIDQLWQRMGKDKGAYFLQSAERSHYLSMLLNKEMELALKEYLEQGGKRVRKFLQNINAEAIDIGVDEKCFSNLNELSDYSKEEAYRKRRAIEKEEQ